MTVLCPLGAIDDGMAIVKEVLNTSGGKHSTRIGMGCKAQTGALADAGARICNTAGRPNPQMNATPRRVQSVLKDILVQDAITELLLVRRGTQVWAYRNRCPHFSVGLDAQPGVIHTYGGEVIMCAHHSALFRFEDGLCIDGPCQGHYLDAVAVRVERGQVMLDTVNTNRTETPCLAPPG